jgi:hypothetical protein
MKTYNYKGVTLERVPSECKCLGCYFLDEETANCFMPSAIELGDDCIDKHTEWHQHFQFREVKDKICMNI